MSAWRKNHLHMMNGITEVMFFWHVIVVVHLLETLKSRMLLQKNLFLDKFETWYTVGCDKEKPKKVFTSHYWEADENGVITRKGRDVKKVKILMMVIHIRTWHIFSIIQRNIKILV